MQRSAKAAKPVGLSKLFQKNFRKFLRRVSRNWLK
jgi:hypothetical protein